MKKLFSLLTAVLFVGTMWGASPATLSFTGKCNGSGTDTDGRSWTITSDATESTWDSDKGIHYGTTNATVTYITLTSASFGDNIIDSVKVEASGNNTPSLSVTVGGVAIGSTKTGITTSNASYTFKPTAQQEANIYKGVVVVTLTKGTAAKKAIYVKSVKVYYSTGSTDPSVSISPMAWDFGDVELNDDEAEGKDFTISGSNLTAALTAGLKHGDHFMYELKSGKLTPTSKAVSAVVTITPFPDVEGTLYDTLVVSGDDMTNDSLIPVQMTVFAPIPVTEITLEKTSTSIIEGKTEKLKATVTPSTATHKDLTWESNAEAVATVANGVVTAVKAGTAIITCKSTYYPTVLTKCTVTVTEPAEEKYIAINLGDITADKKVIITMTDGEGDMYALYSENGTNSAPTAVPVTLKNDTIKVLNNKSIFWNIAKEDGKYIIYVDGTIEKWLYCLDSSNNGIRVGTNENKNWVVDGTYGYLQNVETNRYMGVYTSSDWRSYTTMHTNISGQTLGFYVKDAGSATALEDVETSVKAVKVLRNGVLYIEKAGKTYNAQGQLVK